MTPFAPTVAESPNDFPHLLAEARNGNREALGKLLEECRNYLLFVAGAHLARHEHATVSAADLVQDALLKAIGAFDEFEGDDEAQLLAWVRRILINRLTNLTVKPCNRMMVFKPRHEPTDSKTPSWAAMLREREKAMREALQRLDADHRQVLVMRYFDQMKWEEIGVRLDRSADAARMVHGRALRELCRLLNKKGRQQESHAY